MDLGFEVVSAAFATPKRSRRWPRARRHAVRSVDDGGGHRVLVPRVVEALRGAPIAVVVGGVVPESDRAALHAAGVSASWPGSTLPDVARVLLGECEARMWREAERVLRRGEARWPRHARVNARIVCKGQGERGHTICNFIRRVEEDLAPAASLRNQTEREPQQERGSFVSVRVVKMRIELPSTLTCRDGRVLPRLLRE